MTDLDEIQQANVRAALRYLHVKIGTLRSLSLALHLPASLLCLINGGGSVTPRTALRVARLADVTLEELIAGEYPPVKTCPHCGKPLRPTTEGENDDG